MSNIIKINTFGGRQVCVPALPGLTLAQAVFLSGRFAAVPLCSGVGRCGRCRMRFVSAAPKPANADCRYFSSQELAEGWRLGCAHVAAPGMEVLVAEAPEPGVDVDPMRKPDGGGFCLAVDLGTTSLHWSALDSGGVMARGVELNPQMGAGSEVVSRLAFARSRGGADILRGLVQDRVRLVIQSLEKAGSGPCREISLAGNPAMTLLALGMPVDGLCAAPYSLPGAMGSVFCPDPHMPPVYVPPLLGPFVGGDVSAGLAALVLAGDDVEYPFVLADMGTNGEFILAVSPTSFYAASVALGPALEGVGLACGTTARPRAISAFRLAPGGLEPRLVGGGDGKPQGVTGTGYLSLLSRLASVGLLDASGRFVSPGRTASPLATRLARDLGVERGEPRLGLPGGLVLWATDCAEIVKVKAAFNVGLDLLLDKAGLAPSDLARLYLAGALGGHVDPDDLESLGFIPRGMGARVAVAGNTSLAGAELVLESPEARDWLGLLPDRTHVLDLASDAGFEARFLAANVLDWVASGPKGAR